MMKKNVKKNADGNLLTMLCILMEMNGEAFPTSAATYEVCMKLIQSSPADALPLPFTAEDIIKHGKKRHCRRE